MPSSSILVAPIGDAPTVNAVDEAVAAELVPFGLDEPEFAVVPVLFVPIAPLAVPFVTVEINEDVEAVKEDRDEVEPLVFAKPA